jgi:hypothetical protein
MTALTPTERQIAHQVILDRWNPHRLAWKVGNHHRLKPSAVERLLNREDFQAEVVRQEAISEGRCADLTVDDRRTRVTDLQALYAKVPGRRVALKMKILDQIREDVGDNA